MAADLVKLSKVISHALRHEPWLYALELDAEGWVQVDELLLALSSVNPAWQTLSRAELSVIAETSSKARFELRADRIRALYGHSTPERIVKPPEAPPELLYHGTSPLRLPIIQQEGLRAMARQYVHLAVSPAIALTVGRRKHPSPVILRVLSSIAWQSGLPFYRGNDVTWLADEVPPRFLHIQDV